jgi:two-component system cell cycle response regulator
MDSFRILLALHGDQAPSDLATELRARGWILQVSRNLADTWAAAGSDDLDAVLLAPLSSQPGDPELASLVSRASEADGPALLVLTDEPARLEAHADQLDDFLSPEDPADVISRRLRFSIARKRSLKRLRQDTESLRAASTTDYKTGLCNDRYFDERCRIDAARAARDGRCLGLLMIDLDEFRQVNKDFGHPFADRVLGKVGDVLRASLRPFDTAARVGGDEFAVLLPDAGLRDARRIAERLRTEIEALPFEQDGVTATITVTVGAASWDPMSDESFEDTVAGADKALMGAKLSGRNKVVSHEGPKDPEDVVEAHGA